MNDLVVSEVNEVAPLREPPLQEGDQITITLGDRTVARTTIVGLNGNDVICAYPATVYFKARGIEWARGWNTREADALRVAQAL